MEKDSRKSPQFSDEDVFDDTVDHLDDADDRSSTGADGSVQEKREKTSSFALPNTTLFKLATQMSRYEQLCRIGKEVEDLHEATTTPGVLNGKMALLNELWTKFSVEHDSLGVGCRTTLFKHRYMTEKVYENAMDMHYTTISLLYELKSKVQNLTTQKTAVDTSSFHQATLPEVKLSTFSGDSSTWPAFRDLFISLVHNRADLRPVSKLHYLKTNLIGPPAQLLLNVQMTDAAYAPAWEQLKERYDDPELLIFAHIHKLFNAPSASSKAPTQLDHLVGTVRQNLDALKALSVPIHETDYFLVYLISNKLDPSLREAWEIRRTSPDTKTTLENLLKFISTRARALESAQAAATQANPWPSQTQLNKKQPSQRQPTPSPTMRSSRVGIQKKADYPCDYCGDTEHFLANCQQFISRTDDEKYKVVLSARLCFNCLGHHSIQVCQSKKSCNKCSQRHHTLIHEPRTASLLKRYNAPKRESQSSRTDGPSTSR